LREREQIALDSDSGQSLTPLVIIPSLDSVTRTQLRTSKQGRSDNPSDFSDQIVGEIESVKFDAIAQPAAHHGDGNGGSNGRFIPG
jgi:hypothetical protein